jgi:hypothetical protein
MVAVHGKSARSLGLWSAVLCTVFSLDYIIAQFGEWAGLLGSAGGQHSRSTTLGLIVLLTPSMLLGCRSSCSIKWTPSGGCRSYRTLTLPGDSIGT